MDAGYRVSGHLKLQLDIFNLTDTHASASSAYYTSRLPGEPAEGVTDYQLHPLEPISARFSLGFTF